MKLFYIVLSLLLTQTAFTKEQINWVNTYQLPELGKNTDHRKMATITRHDKAVEYHYAIEQDKILNSETSGYLAESREYWLDTTAEKLSRGIQLPLSSEIAVIRVTPLEDKQNNSQINIDSISVTNNNREPILIDTLVNSDQLNLAGARFQTQTIAFKIKPERAQDITLKIDLSNTDNTPYVIHVLEPQSKYISHLKSNKVTYNSGEQATIKVNMQADRKKIAAEIQGFIRSPDGSEHLQLNFSPTSEHDYLAQVSLPKGQAMTNGLWEIHAYVKSSDNGITVMRDLQSSFSVNLNTARFTGALNLSKQKLNFEIETVLDGRYEIRGILMGTDANGSVKPMAVMMSANWLKAGKQKLSFNIANTNITQHDYLTAPFYIEQLELRDQSRMASIQKVNSGVQFSQ